MFKKNLAFTLAETLIVIAIIGVVAALTLPNLNSSTADKEKVTKVKKIYAALTEATDRAQAVYGPIDGWFNDIANLGDYPTVGARVKNRITEFMKVSKDCGHNTGCWDEDLMNEESSYVNLADGMSLEIFADAESGTLVKIEVDLDGPNKGKNESGSDIFYFTLRDNVANGTPKNQLIPEENPNFWTGAANVASYPTAWIINNGNMDYLKATYKSGVYICPGNGEEEERTLNWETKTSCN